MSLMMKRTSVRKYKTDPISDDIVNQLLRSAMQAPSANNQQPWEFVVIRDIETKRRLSQVSRGAWMLEDAPLCITVIMRETEKSPIMAPQDCAACVQNILLEAVNLGLGAVWIGVYPIQERTQKVNEILNITNNTAFANIAIGYPFEDKTVVERFDSSRVHFEKVQ